MPTSAITPTYYRVTWSGTSPTNYNALTLNQAGGVDNTAPEKYLRLVRAVGSQANPTVVNGDTIKINGVSVVFTTAGGLNLAGIISTINALNTETRVLAIESPSTYLTLYNTSGTESEPIVLESVTANVITTKLGLQVGTYNKFLIQQGGTTTLPLLNGDNIKINGVTVTFVTGGLDRAGVISAINANSLLTNVSARAGGAGIVLESLNGQPFTLAAGTTAGTLATLGFTAGNKGGSIDSAVDNMTLAQSLDKERASMRWDAIVNELGALISPVFFGEVVKTGNLNGTVPVTTVSFTVGYDRPSFLSLEDSLNAGVMLTGAACVRRLVARALVNSYTGKQEFFDPTLWTSGNTCVRPNPLQILDVTAQALDTAANIATVESNITVTQIANI